MSDDKNNIDDIFKKFRSMNPYQEPSSEEVQQRSEELLKKLSNNHQVQKNKIRQFNKRVVYFISVAALLLITVVAIFKFSGHSSDFIKNQALFYELDLTHKSLAHDTTDEQKMSYKTYMNLLEVYFNASNIKYEIIENNFHCTFSESGKTIKFIITIEPDFNIIRFYFAEETIHSHLNTINIIVQNIEQYLHESTF